MNGTDVAELELLEEATSDTVHELLVGALTLTGELVPAWLSDELRVELDRVYAEYGDWLRCTGCGEHLAHEMVGGTRHCGFPERYCPVCWRDLGPAQWCGHPEHW